MKLTKPLLLLVVDLGLIGCATSTNGAGCVTYRRYAPSIEPTISDFMLDQLTQLDAAMEEACR
jgi:hypothetical protein